MKKVFCLFLTVFLLLASAVPAFAEHGEYSVVPSVMLAEETAPTPDGSCCFFCKIAHCCDSECPEGCVGFCLCCYWWLFLVAGILILTLIVVIVCRSVGNPARRKLLRKEERYIRKVERKTREK